MPSRYLVVNRFWILDWLHLQRMELDIRQNSLMIPLKRGGLKLFFWVKIQNQQLIISSAPSPSGNQLEALRPKGEHMDEIELWLFRTT